MTPARDEEPEPELPAGWPVLVTGAGGFVGGHVARTLARAGYRVRAFSRRAPEPEPGDPPLEWFQGDLCRPEDRVAALRGMKAVVHSAGWVSIGPDRLGQSRRINVEATEALLDQCAGAGVERFVYTSTLWTTAAGTVAQPADESTPWNLGPIRSPYSETKREAERLVLERNGPGLRTAVICPGLVVGPRDRKPTSTGLILTMARSPCVMLPRGGIPLIDARVLALAHRRALEFGAPGGRYVVCGTYLSYIEIARLVTLVAGWPRLTIVMPDGFEPPLRTMARVSSRLCGDRLDRVSEAVISGGFLRLHVSGARADSAFGLIHPPPIQSIFEALDDHRRSRRAPWLRLRAPCLEAGEEQGVVVEASC